MSETFTPLASSRANYYCKGSPVHFAMVELFKLEETGSTVVTLTFKNLYSHAIRTFTAHFCCKDRQGGVLGEDDFEYRDVDAREGECFGSDDGVFICDEPLGSVEVTLVSVIYDDGILHSLKRCPPVQLPALQPMEEPVRAAVRAALPGCQGLRYYPAKAEDGWRCACGGFNYNAGLGRTMCSECGAGKTELLQAVRDAQRSAYPRREAYDAGADFSAAGQPAAGPVRPHEYGKH